MKMVKVKPIQAVEENALPSDGVLLRRFAAQGDQEAFRELVHRHSGLVNGVCQRIIHHEQDAEDVKQAVFLLLAQRSKHLSKRTSVAGWLHYAAQYAALRARRSRGRREEHEGEYSVQQNPARKEHLVLYAEELDGAIADLSEKYRVPIILHYMEGRTYEEIAGMLGCEIGAIKMRISRGCEKLRKCLGRRGVVLSVAGLFSQLSQDTWTKAPSSTFVQTCSQAAMALVEKGSCADMVGPNVQTLMKGVQHMFFVKKLKLIAAAGLALALVAGGLAIVAPPMSSQASAGPNDSNNPIPQELRVQIYALLASTGINADSYTKYEFFKVFKPWGTVFSRSFQVHLVNSDGIREYLVAGKQVSYKSPQYVTYIYDSSLKVVAGPFNIMP